MTYHRHAWDLRLAVLIAATAATAAGCQSVLGIDGEYRIGSADGPGGPDGGSRDGGSRDAGASACRVQDCPTGGECMQAVCRLGACEQEPLAAGERCDSEGGRVCDGLGACVACRIDGERNDQETDSDCGGPDCPACAAGFACDSGDDCDSGICHASGLCDTPRCNDGVKNGREGAIDCGGDCLKPCAQGGGCEDDDDCDTGHCADGVCCGVACDGLCEQCTPGTGACTLIALDTDPDDECEGPTNFCDGAGGCTGCNDLDKNGLETDVDCGGPECRRCGDGLVCAMGSDCLSCVCEQGVCDAPRCGNGEQDGCETDVDCGGPCGATCGDGQACGGKLDCASHACLEGRCVGP